MGGLTYKLEPGLSRITSPVRLVFPAEGKNGDGRREEYDSGLAVTEAEFDKKWRVVEMRARDDVIEVILEQMDVPYVNPIGEETFF